MTPEDEKRARDCDRAWAASEYEGATLPVLDRRDLLAALDAARAERDKAKEWATAVNVAVNAAADEAEALQRAARAAAIRMCIAVCEDEAGCNTPGANLYGGSFIARLRALLEPGT